MIFKNISPRESLYFEAIKAVMLFEVVFGHAVALILPKFSELDISTYTGLIYALIRSVSGFGREAAFQFIFLSGYFCAPYLFRFNQKFYFLEVLKKRLYRLYPTLVIALVFTLVIDFVGAIYLALPIYKNNGLHYDFSTHWSLEIFFLNLASLQPTFGLTFGSNGPLWTLGYLIQFFIIGATICYANNNNNKNRLFASSVIAVVILLLTSGWESSLLFVVWSLGAIVRCMKTSIISHLNSKLIVFIIILFTFIARFSHPLISIILTPIIGVGLCAIIGRVSHDLPNKTHKWIKEISSINYTMYAVHMPILFISVGLFQTYLSNNKLLLLESLFLLAAVGASVVVMSYLVQKIVNSSIKA